MKIRHTLGVAIIVTAIVVTWWLATPAGNPSTKITQNHLAPLPASKPLIVLAPKSPEVVAPTAPPAPVSTAMVNLDTQTNIPTGPPVLGTPTLSTNGIPLSLADLKRQAAMQKQRIDAMQAEREGLAQEYGEAQLDPANNFMADQLQEANQEVVARQADLDKFADQPDSTSYATAESAYQTVQNKLNDVHNEMRRFTLIQEQFDELNKGLQAAEPIYDNLLSAIQQQENATPSGQ
jgi:hypothetical protein